MISPLANPDEDKRTEPKRALEKDEPAPTTEMGNIHTQMKAMRYD